MSAPPTLSGDFARHLCGRQADLIGADSTVVQTGGAHLPEPLALPIEWDMPVAEPLIETFVVEPTGSCMGTGDDERLIDAWLPLAEEMSKRVLAALTGFGVELEGSAYLTASLTPLDQVTDIPHFDDDHYNAEAGVGVFAIVGSHAGPRLMNEPIRCQPVRSGLPLVVAPDLFDRFAAGDFAAQQAEADRIVMMPTFGQLHAGPTAVPPVLEEGQDQLRRLMVFRAQTVPTVAVGSGPV